jgi:glucose/arabinose dehydrogenase
MRLISIAVAAGAAVLLAIPLAAQTVPPGFQVTDYATGLASPTAMDFSNDGRLFICEQGGTLRVRTGGTTYNFGLGITVTGTNERGLLGVAPHPNYSTTREVYVYYSESGGSFNRVSRFVAQSGNLNARDMSVAEVLLLQVPMSSGYHNGGALHFGPDGMLYLGVGEAHSGSAQSQSVSSYGGKILRINPSDGTAASGNPTQFRNSTGGTLTPSGQYMRIFAMGLRNPFTFAFQPGSNRMFINDVGQGTWEEVDEGTAGSVSATTYGVNYGWEGGSTDGPTTNSNYRGPLYAYQHTDASNPGYPRGNCIAGGAFYPASGPFPSSYYGRYFLADYVSDWVAYINPTAPPANNGAPSFATGFNGPSDVKVGADGALYVLELGAGRVRRIAYTSTSDQIPVVAFTTPASGATVSGNVAVNATANDPDIGPNDGNGISNVVFQLYQGATLIATAPTENSAPYDWSPAPGLNTTLYPNGAYTLRATATSSQNGATGVANRNITINNPVSNTPPTATINTPAAGSRYSAGQTINYSGSGTDPEDGTLGASAFTWRVDFHHDTHTHPVIPDTSGVTSGSFTAPTVGEVSANVFYRITLTVRDSAGATNTVTRDVLPNTSVMSFATSPSGLQIRLDGGPQATPSSVTGVVGMQRTLGHVSPQTSGSNSYSFVSWSDGGAGTHTISTPSTNTTYTATYGLDTDGDGMADSVETAFGLDLNNGDEDNSGQPDGLDDWDGDGVNNSNQAANGVSPGSPGSTGAARSGNSGGGFCGATGFEALILLALLRLRRKK